MREGLLSPLLIFVLLPFAGAVQGQQLADYDYENLSLDGLGFELGYLFPSRVEGTSSMTVRLDLGFLGPGFRLSPSMSFWNADFKAAEVAELELRLADLIVQAEPGSTPTVDLGTLNWSDVVLGFDGQYVWTTGRLENFIGTGFAAHIMNGEGDAISGTFVEDLLDRWTIGINGHAGTALIMSRRFRISGQFRYELLDDLSYPEIRIGGVLVFGSGGAR